MRACAACNAPIDSVRVAREAECKKCGAELHSCVNCRFHDPQGWKRCREPQAEPPRDSDRANFCDYFELADRQAVAAGLSEADKAKAAFDAAFSSPKKKK